MPRILLIKRGGLGDLLMATPLIRQLSHTATVQVDLIVGDAASVAIKGNPYLNKVFVLADSCFTRRGSITLAKFLYNLKDAYQQVWVLDKHWYFNLLAHLVNAPLIGYH